LLSSIKTEGLNPETISPEEDFTSLSEEEEGEIKNYERRRKLNRMKKELQRKAGFILWHLSVPHRILGYFVLLSIYLESSEMI
jgi:predicted nucleic acid-binding Zn ribbon protein